MATRKLFLPCIKYSRLDADLVESKAQMKRLEMERISTRLKSLKDDEIRLSKCIDELEVFHRDLFVLPNTVSNTSEVKNKSSTIDMIKKAKTFLTEPDYSTNSLQYSIGGQEVMMEAPEVFVAQQYSSVDNTANSAAGAENKSSTNDGTKRAKHFVTEPDYSTNPQQYTLGCQEVVMNSPEVFVVQLPSVDQSEGSVVETYNIVDQPGCSSNEPDYFINEAEEDLSEPHYVEIQSEVSVNEPVYILDLSSATFNETGYTVSKSEISVNEPNYSVNPLGLSINEPDFLVTQPGTSANEPDYLVNQPGISVDEPAYLVNQSGLSTNDHGYLINQPHSGVPQQVFEKMDSTENESFNIEDKTDNGFNISSDGSYKSNNSRDKSSSSSDKSSSSSDKSSSSSDKSSSSSDKSSSSSDKSSSSDNKSSDRSDKSKVSGFKLDECSIKSNDMRDKSNDWSKKSSNSSIKANDMSDQSNNVNHISNKLSHKSNSGCQKSNYVGEESGDIKEHPAANQDELVKNVLRNLLESKEREVTALLVQVILKFYRFKRHLRAAEKINLTRLTFFSSQSNNFESKLQKLSETILYLDQKVFKIHSKYFDMLNCILEC